MTRTNKRASMTAAAVIGMLFCLMATSLLAGADPWEDQVKQAYDYANWGPDTGQMIAGIAVSRHTLPWLDGMWRIWPEDDYSVEVVDSEHVSRIRQYWIGETENPENPASRLLIEMIVGRSHQVIQEYLITRYIESQALIAREPGVNYGFNLGHLSFVYTEDGGSSFTTIDFVRHNVLFMFYAEGPLRYELANIAQALDSELSQNSEFTQWTSIDGLPELSHFCPHRYEIEVGDSTPFVIRFYDQPTRPARYLWTVDTGGIDTNRDGSYIYISDAVGYQEVTLAVINDLGLFDVAQTNIDVYP